MNQQQDSTKAIQEKEPGVPAFSPFIEIVVVLRYVPEEFLTRYLSGEDTLKPVPIPVIWYANLDIEKICISLSLKAAY